MKQSNARRKAETALRSSHPLSAPVYLTNDAETEPLRLAYEASRTLVHLSPFIAAADLTMERLWYKVVSRSVELRDFERGLYASAFLQMCLDRREGDDLIRKVGDRADCCLVLVPTGGQEEEVHLRPFASPGSSGSMALAKLVAGASLNACRCCLEVGSREALRMMVGELGRVAGRWIERVGKLGDDATAGEYCRLFELCFSELALSRACFVL